MVPTRMASADTPVSFTKRTASSALVNSPMRSSFVVPTWPSSPSTLTPQADAISTTRFVMAIFSSIG